MNAIWSGAIHAQGMLLSDIRWKDPLDALRGIIEAKHFKKHPFQTDAVASSWLNQSRDDRKSKTRPRNKHQIIRQKLIMQNGRSKRSLHESQGEPRGERDVIRLRNPTEDKRAFRQMLTSADRAPTRSGKMQPRDTSLLTGTFLAFRFNQSAVATSQAFSHATLNDSLLIL